MNLKEFIEYSWGSNKRAAPAPLTPDKGVDDRPVITQLPNSRQSVPLEPSLNNGTIKQLASNYSTINIHFIRRIIPIIRSLCYMNPDVSQAMDNVITLGNTGHKVYFDRKVPTEQVDAMRNHLENKRKLWASGQAGMNGLINKMFAQLLISGAISNEWVPNVKLNGIEACVLVNPEKIDFMLDERETQYEPYQIIDNGIPMDKDTFNLRKLNTNTYRYFALNGDNELPFGIPPYLSVVTKIQSQGKMAGNIDFIVDTMGLVGFLEVLIDKPSQTGPLANNEKYAAHLTALLTQAKDAIMGSVKEGVIVGFKGDHEFKFNSASKTFQGVVDLFQENELQVFSGLKQDAALAGRGYATSETQITVVFMKLLSQLRNMQNLIKENLEFGYGLELKLAGYKFDFLKVKFDRSTIQDDLKFQQAEEIKVRNVKDKLILGLIDQDQAADELGYEVPAFPEPQVAWDVLAGQTDPAAAGLATDGTKKKQDRKDQKKKSEKGSRDKSKP